jgi:hypothetical protein
MPLNQPPPPQQDLAAVLGSAQQLVHWIAERQDGLEIKKNNAIRVPGVLLDLCLEHHVGIVHLVTGRMYGSAFALVRAQFEALVRALWLHLCATPDELQIFVDKDVLPLNFGQMIESIEKHEGFRDKVLSTIKIQVWRAMHGFTHGGMHQIARRMKGDSIEPNYEGEEIIEVLKASGLFALMALFQIGRLANSDKVIDDVAKRLSGES